jgi:hypothetical protein
MADVAPALRPAFVAYLERKVATCRERTVTGTATRLAHFGRFLAEIDPDLSSLAELDRERHIEAPSQLHHQCCVLPEAQIGWLVRSSRLELTRNS